MQAVESICSAMLLVALMDGVANKGASRSREVGVRLGLALALVGLLSRVTTGCFLPTVRRAFGEPRSGGCPFRADRPRPRRGPGGSRRRCGHWRRAPAGNRGQGSKPRPSAAVVVGGRSPAPAMARGSPKSYSLAAGAPRARGARGRRECGRRPNAG